MVVEHMPREQIAHLQRSRHHLHAACQREVTTRLHQFAVDIIAWHTSTDHATRRDREDLSSAARAADDYPDYFRWIPKIRRGARHRVLNIAYGISRNPHSANELTSLTITSNCVRGRDGMLQELHLPKLTKLRVLAPAHLDTAEDVLTLLRNHAGTLKSLRVSNINIWSVSATGSYWLDILHTLRDDMVLEDLQLSFARYITGCYNHETGNVRPDWQPLLFTSNNYPPQHRRYDASGVRHHRPGISDDGSTEYITSTHQLCAEGNRGIRSALRDVIASVRRSCYVMDPRISK
ncbi:hypothetical protein LTR85_002794 [Meristemomyces frigidus]|nr:hypothetical protein LTR85_002794 [Meristemomyces frigidus]